MRPEIHIAIMHDRRRAARLQGLCGWLGHRLEDVNRFGAITIGNGSDKGPWNGFKRCIDQALDRAPLDGLGRPWEWLLLLQDDAVPTTSSIVDDYRGPDGDSPGEVWHLDHWPIKDACAELVRGIAPCVIHLCCTGGAAAERMDVFDRLGEPLAPLMRGEPVGHVGVLIHRVVLEKFRVDWQDWTRDLAWEDTYSATPHADDMRLRDWCVQVGVPRCITTRSLVEHGGAASLTGVHSPDAPHRYMHNPIEKVTPLEWVRSFSGGRSGFQPDTDRGGG